MYFEWDPAKALRNVAKHAVSFEEAATVFGDPLGRIYEDPIHSVDEPRDLILGLSDSGRVLVVAFTERAAGLRIISARQSTRRERKVYEDGH